VTSGYQCIADETSGGWVPRSQSGSWKASDHDHHTIGSEGFCRYRALGWAQPAVSAVGPAEPKRTVRPPWYTGCHSGLPGARPAVNRLHSVLVLVGPTQSTPDVRSRMSSTPLNAASPPNEPRLSPNTTSLGLRSAGSRCHAS
jgi:hypothetical protein